VIRAWGARGRRFLARWGRQLLALGLVPAVLGLLVWLVIQEWDTLKTFPWQLNGGYLVLASAFHSLALAATFVVWYLMLRRLGGFDDVRRNFAIYYLSTLAKRIPSAIWYIGGRLMMYQQVGVSRSVVLNATALETLLIGTAGILVYLLLQPFYSYAIANATWILAAVGGLAGVAFLVRPRLLLDLSNALLRRLKKNPIQVDLNRRDLLLWCGIYLLPSPLAGVSLYFMIRAVTVDTQTDLPSIIGVSTLSMLVALLTVILPGGLGLKELTVAGLLSTWMPLSAGVVIAIVYRILQTIDEVLWAALAHLVGARAEGATDKCG